jgi:hypothetical protein
MQAGPLCIISATDWSFKPVVVRHRALVSLSDAFAQKNLITPLSKTPRISLFAPWRRRSFCVLCAHRRAKLVQSIRRPAGPRGTQLRATLGPVHKSAKSFARTGSTLGGRRRRWVMKRAGATIIGVTVARARRGESCQEQPQTRTLAAPLGGIWRTPAPDLGHLRAGDQWSKFTLTQLDCVPSLLGSARSRALTSEHCGGVWCL